MFRHLVLLCLWSVAVTTQADDLLSIYQQALRSDPSLKAAQLQRELSDAQQGQAGSALLPQVNANVNFSHNDRHIESQGTDTYNGERYSVSLTQAVFDLPKTYNWRRYQALTEKSDADFQQAQQVLIYEVVERYFTVLATQDGLGLIAQETHSTEQQLQQIQRQYEKNIVKITDVYELEAKLDGLVAQGIEIETNLDIAKQSLIELTGEPFTNLAILLNNIQFVELEGNAQGAAEQAQQDNLLIKAQEKEILAADYNLTSQHAKHLPVVDIQLQYYNTDNGFQNSQTPVIDTKVASINVTIPLFSGGGTYFGAQEAAKQLAMSKQRKVSLRRSIEKETRDAFLSANASVRRIRAADKALKTSIKAREAMEQGFKYGMQSIGDVLISQAREYSANRDLLEAKYTYIRNRIRFQHVSGTLDYESLEEVNQWLIGH